MIQIENVLFKLTLGIYLASCALYFIYFAFKKEKIAKIAYIVTAVGFVIHTASIVLRGIDAHRLPLTNLYEFSSAFAWGICLCFLIFEKKSNFPLLGAFVTPLIFLVIGYAAMQNKEIHQVMPALQSNWLGFHVFTAIIAYGSFGVACGMSAIYLLHDKLKNQKNLPSKEKLDDLSYRSISLGFLFLTLCMITGAIWAKKAWGTYWNWDPKETWSLITWLIYAVYLHLRLNRKWKGKSTAILAVVGFVCVIFTFVGVNTLLSGLHSYAS